LSAPAASHALNTRRGFCAAASSETHEFKAETKKLLDIVAKSLYTDKEVFVRELISNASDACEKLRFLQGASQLQAIHDDDLTLQVKLSVDEAARKFIIQDSGVGMTRDELVANLGTIAKSGSLDFLEKAESDSSNIIGQFGVGFYSTFVVADKVEVFTKTCDPEKGDQGYMWSSDGDGSYTITEAADVQRGTKIILTLKDDAAEFSKLATVKKSCEKFSSFIDFPIVILEEGEEKAVNKQEALWMKSSATEDEHKDFFRFLSSTSYGEPFYTLMYQTDAPLSIKSCFYVPDPDNAPSRMFTRDPEVGIALHSRRVLVKKQADGVIPKWLHWMKGVVDCEDMPLNISRENMQDTRLMEKLSTAVVRRILRFLDQQAKKDEVKYAKFFKGYSYYLKAGIIEDKEANGGRHKDDILKLLRFDCSHNEKGEVISLEEYVKNSMDGQKNIYYFTVPDRHTAMSSPYMEQFVQRKRNVLLMFEEIDEYVVNSIEGFKDKKFVSIDSADKDFELDLDQPEEDKDKKEKELSGSEQKDLEKFIKSVLKERVQEVKFSDRLVHSPAIVTSIITPHMRKMMKNLMAGRENDGMNNVPMTLELSPSHHIVTTLNTIKDSNDTVARIAVEQLYDNACIAAGTLDDPRVLMARLNKVLEMFIYQGAGFDYARNEYVTAASDTAASTDASQEPPPKQDEKKVDSDDNASNESKPKFEESKPKFEEVKTSS
jgi:TNF receptor-associated protein 1